MIPLRLLPLALLGVLISTPLAQAQEAVPDSLSADELAAYAGRFAVGAFGDASPTLTIELSVDDGHLVANVQNMAPTRMLYRGNGRFDAEAQTNAHITFGDAGQNRDTFIAATPGGPMVGVRIEE